MYVDVQSSIAKSSGVSPTKNPMMHSDVKALQQVQCIPKKHLDWSLGGALPIRTEAAVWRGS